MAATAAVATRETTASSALQEQIVRVLQGGTPQADAPLASTPSDASLRAAAKVTFIDAAAPAAAAPAEHEAPSAAEAEPKQVRDPWGSPTPEPGKGTFVQSSDLGALFDPPRLLEKVWVPKKKRAGERGGATSPLGRGQGAKPAHAAPERRRGRPPPKGYKPAPPETPPAAMEVTAHVDAGTLMPPVENALCLRLSPDPPAEDPQPHPIYVPTARCIPPPPPSPPRPAVRRFHVKVQAAPITKDIQTQTKPLAPPEPPHGRRDGGSRRRGKRGKPPQETPPSEPDLAGRGEALEPFTPPSDPAADIVALPTVAQQRVMLTTTGTNTSFKAEPEPEPEPEPEELPEPPPPTQPPMKPLRQATAPAAPSPSPRGMDSPRARMQPPPAAAASPRAPGARLRLLSTQSLHDDTSEALYESEGSSESSPVANYRRASDIPAPISVLSDSATTASYVGSFFCGGAEGVSDGGAGRDSIPRKPSNIRPARPSGAAPRASSVHFVSPVDRPAPDPPAGTSCGALPSLPAGGSQRAPSYAPSVAQTEEPALIETVVIADESRHSSVVADAAAAASAAPGASAPQEPVGVDLTRPAAATCDMECQTEETRMWQQQMTFDAEKLRDLTEPHAWHHPGKMLGTTSSRSALEETLLPTMSSGLSSGASPVHSQQYSARPMRRAVVSCPQRFYPTPRVTALLRDLEKMKLPAAERYAAHAHM
eukprot:TRINITY_DN3797_c0_g3_i1.p1 TRINITY_DN3797_c0_g3~~TRINITY_DN3797_c0_g3_i1.p1  ORF type:complete len:768 (+),score=187.57 TRINITY_DN3797_c0_g3_i1:183-2306(+)